MRVRVFVAGLQLRRCLQRLREGAALCRPYQIKSHHNSIARMCTEKAGVTVDDDMISDFHRKIGVGVGCNAFVVGVFAVGYRPDPPPHLWLIIHPGAFSPWHRPTCFRPFAPRRKMSSPRRPARWFECGSCSIPPSPPGPRRVGLPNVNLGPNSCAIVG